MDTRPIAELVIIPRGRMTSYRVYAGDTLVWATRATSTPEGVQGARERMRAWMRRDGYRVVLRKEEEHTARKVG